jgi:hypothetical protein
MRKWLAIGAVIVVVVLWYSYFSSSRAEQTERDREYEAETASAPPPPMAATPAQPAVKPEAVAAKPATVPTPATEERGATPPDRNALFAHRFETETRDALWANEQEPALKKQLSEIELKDDSVSAVECRSTVCRVTFKRPRVSEGEAIHMYSRLLTTFGDVQLANHDPGSAEAAHFYTLRKGYTLDTQ